VVLVQMVWSNARPEWKQVFGGKPHTIGSLHMNNFSVVEELAQQQQDVSQPLQRAVPGHSAALATT
jgi:hypothetical protein